MVEGVTPATSAAPFDKVVVAEGAGQRDLSPQEFFALPLALRVQYVVQQRASFFSSGRQVDARLILGQMRRMRAQLH